MRIRNGVLYNVCDKDIKADGSFIVPNNATSIGDYAFWNCSKLKSITIPEGVTSIGEGAFEGCNQLTSVTIPNSVKDIGDWAFNACSSIVSLTIPNSVKTLGEYVFSDCEKLPSVTIPDGVISIGDFAFYNCPRLKSVTIGNSVTTIGGYAFQNCNKLTSITIGKSVTNIGEWAFFSCVGLTSKRANYKAFSLTKEGELMCRYKTYAVGEKSTVEGLLEICHNGIHYCTNLYDIFTYYAGEYGKDFVIGVCEVSEENIGVDIDSKHCARWIIPTRILSREEVINILNGEE